jgi:hypothetical protein
MIWILSRKIDLLMARLTFQRCVLICIGITGWVAGFTIHNRMNTHQGKTRLIMGLKDLLYIVPGSRCMTILTLETQLRLMYIFMTINTGDTNMGKVQT